VFAAAGDLRENGRFQLAVYSLVTCHSLQLLQRLVIEVHADRLKLIVSHMLSEPKSTVGRLAP
jgi:hypothetical protein